MESYKISVNQLAIFSGKTEKGKVGIIKQQLKPSTAVVTQYSKAKKIVARTLINNGNKKVLLDGIEELKKTVATTDWQIQNKTGSIAALEKFSKKVLPHIILDSVFESIKPLKKNRLYISDVEIVVSPDIIIKTIINGEAFFGAIKIHISKSATFDREEAKYVTTCLFQYMNEHYGKIGTIWSELCLCVDVFGDNIKYAPSQTDNTIQKISNLCDEIKKIWQNAAA